MENMDYISILRELSEEMYQAIWSTYERFQGKIPPKELGHKVDLASAYAAKDYLVREHLKLMVVAEEGFDDYNGKEKPILVLDPIDGTSNFSRGIPFSSISLALAEEDSLSHVFAGLVRDLFREEIYWAVRGEGAYLNNSRIRVKPTRNTVDAHFSVNINRAFPGKYIGLNILPYIPYSRHFGSAALEGCYVASGKIDAYIDVRGALRVFDIAAAYLITKEAGGKTHVLQNGSREVILTKVGGISVVFAATSHLMERISDLLGYP